MNRRLFLTHLLQGGVGGLSLAQSGLAASVLARKRLSTIGMQLYTVRRELERDFAGTLAQAAALGFREVEFAGYFGHRPTEVKALLTRHNLTSPAAHVTLAALRGNLREMIDAAHVIGHRYILVAYLPAEDRRSLDDYKRLADLFNRAGAQLKREGIQFAYHNHDFEFAPLGGQVPYDLVLESTDPQAVKLELDLYWMAKAGQSPLKYFAKHPGAITCCTSRIWTPPRNTVSPKSGVA